MLVMDMKAIEIKWNDDLPAIPVMDPPVVVPIL
jgi:hypothetical protein